MASIAETNQQIISSITNTNFLNVIGWLIFAIVIIGGVWFYLVWSRDKKLFNKRITIMDIVGGYYEPIARDTAKTVKIGKGGFEILYLKKAKTWKIGYGGRVGKTDYYFYIVPGGYWYNGMMSANVHFLDKSGGLVPIVTTNPLMRGQYTALEKQIDSLFTDKKSFMDKYGVWIFAIAFILIVGVLTWLIWRELSPALGQLNTIMDKEAQILTKLDSLLGTSKVINQGGTGLIPAT